MGTPACRRTAPSARALWIAVAVVGGFGAGCGGGLDGLFAPGPVEGELRFDPGALPAADHRLGRFRVTWSPADGGQVRISHADAPEHVLWSSVPGAAFVGAGRGRADVEESRGSFTIEEHREEVYAHQHVAGIAPAEGGLVVSGELRGEGGTATPYVLRLEPVRTRHLRLVLRVADPGINRTYLTYASDPGERFFGFGEQFSYFDLKGRRVPIFVMEQGIGRGAQPLTWGANLLAGAGGDWHTSYAPVPQYVTSRARSFFLETSEHAVFDLRRDDRVHVELFAGELVGRVLAGGSPAELVEAYTEHAGRMRPLPDWVHEGAIVGMQGGTARVREVLAALEAHDVPVAAFWLQDWVGPRRTSFGKQLWWSWELDRSHYPGWDELVADLRQRGIHVLTYANPFLVDVSERADPGRNLFAEARDAGFLVRHPDGGPYMIQNTSFSAALVDLTNPAARAWLKDVLREEVLGVGASGWMADFGEALPWDAVLHSGEPAATLHNRYPEMWARLNREVVEASERSEELVFFTRAGYTRSPRWSTLFWLGDQLVSWDAHDGIKTAVTGLLSSGLSGYSLNHSDIGGYTTVTNPLADYHRSEELLLRWMELNAFTPVFRTHEGNDPGKNVQFYTNERTLAHFARTATLYTAWAETRRALVAEAAATGLPVVRHPVLHHPDDPAVLDLAHEQFLLGPDLLIAPVLDPGVDAVDVYLPAGRWVHLWSGDPHGVADRGTRVRVAAPLGEPAVFYREGSAAGMRLVANLEAAGLLR